MEESALILAGPDSEYLAALTLGSDWKWPATRNGKACHYYWKEALPAGQTFYDAKGKDWSFPEADIDGIVSTLKLAQSRQFEPFAPAAHPTKDNPSPRNLGYIVDARKNAKGNLEVLHQFIGDEARDEALTKKTSICILPQATDEHGNVYRNLIDHNAVLPNPRLSNLSDFIPALAASRGQATSAIYLELAAPTPKEAPAMDLTTLRNLVGAAQTLPDDQVIKLAETKITGALQLSSDLDAARTKIQELGTTPPVAKPAKPSAVELHYFGKTLNLSRDEAVAVVGVDVINAAAKQFLGSPDFKTDALTLSRDTTDEDAKTVEGMKRMIDFCELVKTAKLQPRKGVLIQDRAMALSLSNLTDEDAAAEKTRVEAVAQRVADREKRAVGAK